MALPKSVPPKKATPIPARIGKNANGPAGTGGRVQPMSKKNTPPNSNRIH